MHMSPHMSTEWSLKGCVQMLIHDHILAVGASNRNIMVVTQLPVVSTSVPATILPVLRVTDGPGLLKTSSQYWPKIERFCQYTDSCVVLRTLQAFNLKKIGLITKRLSLIHQEMLTNMWVLCSAAPMSACTQGAACSTAASCKSFAFPLHFRAWIPMCSNYPASELDSKTTWGA